MEIYKMFNTKNGLLTATRIQIISLLQDKVACSLDLMSQAKQAHWNVKGPTFMQLHELFDKIASAAAGYTDTIAERIMILGGSVSGTVRSAAGKTCLPEYPLDAVKCKEHVAAMSTAVSIYGNLIRKDIDQALKLNDQVTANMLMNILEEVDKLLWFIEAHAQADN